jgi:nitrile hydratase
MNGAHDMGGVHGFGAVEPEPDEPVFHAAWERRAFAITVAMGATGEWNIDMSRFARENRAPADYLAKSYYELWLAGLEALLAECRLVSAEELAAGRAGGSPRPVKRVLAADDVDQVLSRGTVAATGCAPGTCTRAGIPACRAMSGATWAPSSACTDVTSFPTAMRRAPARIRGGSTRCASTAANCGAPRAIRS